MQRIQLLAVFQTMVDGVERQFAPGWHTLSHALIAEAEKLGLVAARAAEEAVVAEVKKVTRPNAVRSKTPAKTAPPAKTKAPAKPKAKA